MKISQLQVSEKFKEINDTLELGKIGPYARFRSHMLRKFHASNLALTTTDENGKLIKGMSKDNIDALQGRGKTNVREAYFKDSRDSLKLEYIELIDRLTISKEYTSEEFTNKVNVKVNELFNEKALELEYKLDEKTKELKN